MKPSGKQKYQSQAPSIFQSAFQGDLEWLFENRSVDDHKQKKRAQGAVNGKSS